MIKRTRRGRINYFGPIEEEAVKLFLSSDDSLFRNEIYNKWLRTPLNKMTESIIRKYKLFRKGVSFDDLHADTLSFLITKASLYKIESKNRAYSYFGTIIKNRLLGELIKDEKRMVNTLGYDDFSSTIESRDDMMYEIKDTPKDNVILLINGFKDYITTRLEKNEYRIENEYKPIYTPNQSKVGYALLDIFDNWESLFGDLDGSNKYNKSLIKSTIIEMTLLNKKEVASGLRKFKENYKDVRGNFINNGIL